MRFIQFIEFATDNIHVIQRRSRVNLIAWRRNSSASSAEGARESMGLVREGPDPALCASQSRFRFWG